jgi:hypothetical protein
MRFVAVKSEAKQAGRPYLPTATSCRSAHTDHQRAARASGEYGLIAPKDPPRRALIGRSRIRPPAPAQAARSCLAACRGVLPLRRDQPLDREIARGPRPTTSRVAS